MKGNAPVRLLYTTPLCFSANAPKQKTFAIVSLSPLSPIRFGMLGSCTIGCMGSSAGIISSSTMFGVWSPREFFLLGVVLSIPCLGLFMCPLAVARLAFKYFRINFLLMLGHPLRKPCRNALRRLDMFGLYNA